MGVIKSMNRFFTKQAEKMMSKPDASLGDDDINRTVKKEKQKKTQVKTKRKVTVQDSIPYEHVYRDGIFVNEQGEYSKTYPIKDVNFKIESPDIQEDIYESYQTFLNSFPSDVRLEITMVNRHLDRQKFHEMIFMKKRGDELDDMRNEWNKVLESKETVGDNEIVKRRYITASCHAADINEARRRFEQIDKTIRTGLKPINQVETFPISAMERLEILYDFYNSGKESDFLLSHKKDGVEDFHDITYEMIEESGESTKDIISPDSMEFGRERMRIGGKYAQALSVKSWPTSLGSDFFTSLNDMKCPMMTSLHLESIDRAEAMKKIQNMQSVINSQVIDAQKKAGEKGYSAALIPQHLQYESDAIGDISDCVQSQNQKLIKVSIVIVHIADTVEELVRQQEQIEGIARARMLELVVLREQQERGLSSVLPFGHNEISIFKSMPTKCAAILLPFELQEVTQKNGFYYGINTESSRLILYNRRNGDNYNALILGRSGSGKSFKAKEEILSSYLGTNDDVIILDPQGEYSPYVAKLGGTVINFSAGCNTHINPFDMDMEYGDELDAMGNKVHTNPLVLKTAYISTLLDTIMESNGARKLSPAQHSIIDRVVSIVYASYLNTGDENDLPTMKTFYYELLAQKDIDALAIAKILEQYSIGTLDLFAEKTNVQLDNRLTCYNVSQLNSNPSLKDLALVACLNDIWNRTIGNRKKGKFTWIYIDEFHLFLKSDTVADFLMSIWKRARQFGGGPTGITQNITDLLNSHAAEAILSNSSLIVMLNQASGDRRRLATMLNISETQQKYIDNVPQGTGLLWIGQSTIPFKDEFPVDSAIYPLISTNASEIIADVLKREEHVMTDEEAKAEEERKKKEEEEKKEDDERAEKLKRQLEGKPLEDPVPDTPAAAEAENAELSEEDELEKMERELAARREALQKKRRAEEQKAELMKQEAFARQEKERREALEKKAEEERLEAERRREKEALERQVAELAAAVEQDKLKAAEAVKEENAGDDTDDDGSLDDFFNI